MERGGLFQALSWAGLGCQVPSLAREEQLPPGQTGCQTGLRSRDSVEIPQPSLVLAYVGANFSLSSSSFLIGKYSPLLLQPEVNAFWRPASQVASSSSSSSPSSLSSPWQLHIFGSCHALGTAQRSFLSQNPVSGPVHLPLDEGNQSPER